MCLTQERQPGGRDLDFQAMVLTTYLITNRICLVVMTTRILRESSGAAVRRLWDEDRDRDRLLYARDGAVN